MGQGRRRGDTRRGDGGWRQIALWWMAVLVGGVKTVKMGADTRLLVADLVPVLALKEKGCVRARRYY